MDRNNRRFGAVQHSQMSLSARRAWIEILSGSTKPRARRVALRKESVDRNYYADKDADWVRVSLSARRAWIEMLASRLADMSDAVALRKESVDRNPGTNIILFTTVCRSPQGERG